MRYFKLLVRISILGGGLLASILLSIPAYSALFRTFNEIDALLADGQKVLILIVDMDERRLNPRLYDEFVPGQGKPKYLQVTEGIIGQQQSLIVNYSNNENVHFIDAHIGRTPGGKLPGGAKFSELVQTVRNLTYDNYLQEFGGERETGEGYMYVKTEDEFNRWVEGHRTVAGNKGLEEALQDINPDTVLVAGCTDSGPVKKVVRKLLTSETKVIVDPDITLIKTSALTEPAAAYENPERNRALMDQLAKDQRAVWEPYEEAYKNQFRIVGERKIRSCAK